MLRTGKGKITKQQRKHEAPGSVDTLTQRTTRQHRHNQQMPKLGKECDGVWKTCELTRGKRSTACHVNHSIIYPPNKSPNCKFNLLPTPWYRSPLTLWWKGAHKQPTGNTDFWVQKVYTMSCLSKTLSQNLENPLPALGSYGTGKQQVTKIVFPPALEYCN